MGLLLDVGYAAGCLVASPFLLFKFATDPLYRLGLGERLGGAPKRSGDRPCLWLHCSSVGEVNLARPLVKELKRTRPDVELNISTMTPAGRDHARSIFKEERVHFYPLDFGFAVARALRRVRPDAVVLVELEIWPNFIQKARRRHVPISVINGRMSQRSHRRYRRSVWYWRTIFRRLAKVGVQSASYGERLAEFGIADRIVVTGNLKYDAAIEFDPAAAAREVRERWGVAADAPLFVAGSTHDPEEKLVAEAYLKARETHRGLRLLIAPRHIERGDEVEKVLQSMGLTVARRSRPGAIPPGAVLLLDTVGELARTYAAATVVFIGGTFCARGGQNMLEPAILGKPVLSGPSLDNFREIADELEKGGGMKTLAAPDRLAPEIELLLADPGRAAEMGRKGLEVVGTGRGALKSTLEMVLGLLPPAAR